MADSIAEAFWRAFGPEHRRAELDARIAALVEDGQAQLRSLATSLTAHDLAAALGRALARHHPGPDAVQAALEPTVVGQVALGLACTRGESRAIQRFERLHFGSIAPALATLGIPEAHHAEVLSVVREKLFVATPERPARIGELVGGGDLTALVRVVAVRAALNLRRKQRPTAIDTDQALAQRVVAQTSPEIAALKAGHKAAFKRAFEAAIGELPPQQRNWLRLSMVHGLSIDELANLHQIHRSTAARRLARVRDALGTRVRHRLRAQLGADRAELESLFRVVQSSLDVSFERLLLPTG